MARQARLTSEEISSVFQDPAARAEFPPILNPEQFAKLFQISVSTTYFWISEGRLDGAVTRVGKHRRIWRDRAIELLFNRGKSRDTQTTSNQQGDS